MTSSTQPQPPAQPLDGPGVAGLLALILAWIVPGLGHFLIGEKARGTIFAIAIYGLFAAGMFVAGIRAINPPEQQIWTYTQWMTGWPMAIAHTIERQKDKELSLLTAQYQLQRPAAEEDSRQKVQERQAYGKDFIQKHPIFAYHPKVQDIGAVYCGIAGMLNLLVMFDVLLRITGSKREVPAPKPATRANPAAALDPAKGGAA